MSNFKTQTEIYQALLNGKKIRRVCFDEGRYIYLKDGITRNNYDVTVRFCFDTPKEWSEYIPTKETKSIKVYGYVHMADGVTFTDLSDKYHLGKIRIGRVPELDRTLIYEE